MEDEVFFDGGTFPLAFVVRPFFVFLDRREEKQKEDEEEAKKLGGLFRETNDSIPIR